MELVKDCKCPKCGTKADVLNEPGTKVDQSKPVFTGNMPNYDYEPGLTWIELHKCGDEKCNWFFYIENGA